LTKAESYRNKIWKSTSLTYTGLEAISLWQTVNSIDLQKTSYYLFLPGASYALAGGVSGLVSEYRMLDGVPWDKAFNCPFPVG
jgi:hypothetical protein